MVLMFKKYFSKAILIEISRWCQNILKIISKKGEERQMKEGRGIRRMERMEKCELLRSCYDYLVLNPVSLQNRSSSCCRLQSSLFAFVLNASACNEVVMREQFSQIHSPNSGRNDRSLGLSKEDETYIVNSLLHWSRTATMTLASRVGCNLPLIFKLSRRK